MNHDNPWKYVRVDPDSVKSNRYLHPTEDNSGDGGDGNDGSDVVDRIDGKYILMDRASKYGLGLNALQTKATAPHPTIKLPDGSSVYRPLTIAETIKARLEDYNTVTNPDGSERSLEERLEFLNKWFWTGTGVAYQQGTTNFKLISASPHLAVLAKDSTEPFVKIDYSSMSGTELDRNETGQKYNTLLTPAEVLKNEGWITALEGDTTLLKNYRDIVIAARKEKGWSTDNLMGFWITDSPSEDQLRALFVYYLVNYSDADGNFILNNSGSFLLVAPQSP